MHIGFDAKRLFLNQTGLGNYSRTLVSALSAAYPEDKISLFTPKTAKGKRTDQFLGTNYEVVTPQKTPRFLHAWWRSIRLAIIAKRKGVEIYHGLSHELPRNLRWTGIKSVVTIHDLIFLRFPENYALIDREIYLRKVKYACKQADAVVAISQKTATDLIEMLRVPASKILVIYQGCDPQFEQPISEEKLAEVLNRYGRSRPYLICVGTIEKRKNQLTLVKSFLAGKFFEQYDLVLVGSEKKHASVIKEYIKGKLGRNAI
jgi:glycosyltransferase involved in cell wall biosynthesis